VKHHILRVVIKAQVRAPVQMSQGFKPKMIFVVFFTRLLRNYTIVKLQTFFYIIGNYNITFYDFAIFVLSRLTLCINYSCFYIYYYLLKTTLAILLCRRNVYYPIRPKEIC